MNPVIKVHCSVGLLVQSTPFVCARVCTHAHNLLGFQLLFILVQQSLPFSSVFMVRVDMQNYHTVCAPFIVCTNLCCDTIKPPFHSTSSHAQCLQKMSFIYWQFQLIIVPISIVHIQLRAYRVCFPHFNWPEAAALVILSYMLECCINLSSYRLFLSFICMYEFGGR